jgi:hypothetical protein
MRTASCSLWFFQIQNGSGQVEVTCLEVSRCVSLTLRRREDYTQMNYLPFLKSISLCFYQHNDLKPLPFPDRIILRMLPTARCLRSLESALLFKLYNIYDIVFYNTYYVELQYSIVEIRFLSFLRNDLVMYIWKVLTSLEYRCSYSVACMAVGYMATLI